MSTLIGSKFNRFTVVADAPKSKSRNAMWLCKCQCGEERNVSTSDLKRGHVKSCGCFRREFTASSKTKHGAAKREHHTEEYEIWNGIKNRCLNPKNPAWEYYGARGVKLFPGWRDSFSEFLAHVGGRPSKNHSIDRFPDKDGNYEPGNVRWATRKEQSQNRRPRRWKNKPIV